MKRNSVWEKIVQFPLTKIVAGILVIVGIVAFCEWLKTPLSHNSQLPEQAINGIIAIMQISLALLAYKLLYRVYERRKISELDSTVFWKGAGLGFLGGFLIQALIILIIFFNGGYFIVRVNPVSFMIPSFITAVVAGFIAELLIRGVFYRLVEEKLGTVISLILMAIIFGVLHSGNGATALSVSSVAIQAGILQSAAYVYTRSLWLPIFMHFAWDFTEPGIFGGINPGNLIDKSLFTSNITGSELLTGGRFGPGHSLESIIICLFAAFILLYLAEKKNNFIKPYWRNRKT